MIFPPGEYYIGDPCYVLKGDDAWDQYIEQKYADGNDAPKQLIEFEGHMVFADYTQFGDGTFYDDRGCKYDVDSGTIGCVPTALLMTDERKAAVMEMPDSIVVFMTPFEPRCEDGVFIFGYIAIDTNRPEEVTTDYDYEEDDE